MHNEVQVGHLADGLTGDDDARLLGLRPRLERALDAFHARHPDRPVTVNYARVPVSAMRAIPENIDVLVTHPYVYGVLDDLITTYGLRGPVEDFDQERVARDLLLPDAPKLADWAPDQPWRWDGHDRGQAGDLRARLVRRRGDRPLALSPLPGLGAGR